MSLEDLRLAVYHSFARTERPPRAEDLAEQRAFCSRTCVDAWCAQTGSPRGHLMDLHALWRLATHWYDGRLHRGYVRREPAAAKQYLRSVGLAGFFSGL